MEKYSSGDMSITTGNLTNTIADIFSGSGLIITATGNVKNTVGTIESNGNMSITANNIENIGEMLDDYSIVVLEGSQSTIDVSTIDPALLSELDEKFKKVKSDSNRSSKKLGNCEM
ncbi:MAG: hypothetical protein LBT51_00830 [Fusobacteriaceae bacterium]|jgi:adhesin HecA-like repeat protein|nr:hypothetical protein [Fusobacteriaceae bacterium]